jgi:hypothetical protein
VTLTSIARAVAFQVFGPEPAGVTRDGLPLDKFATAAEFAAAPSGWWHDAAAGFLHIKFPHSGGTVVVAF